MAIELDLTQQYEDLVNAHREAFRRLARRLARNPDDAEDLLQETLVDAYRGFARFEAGSSFYSWVSRIMINNSHDRARRKQHPCVSLEQLTAEAGDAADVPDDRTDPARVLVRRLFDAPLEAALDNLRPHQRDTVLLCDVEGATYEEAASVQDCPVGTIRSRLHRAHRAVKEFLARLDPMGEPIAEATRVHSRRQFLRMGTAAAAGAAFSLAAAEGSDAATPLRVVVVAPGEPGATPLVQTALGELEGVQVLPWQPRTAIPPCDVLICVNAAELAPPEARELAERVRDGAGLVVLEGPTPVLDELLGLAGERVSAVADQRVDLNVRLTAPRHPIARGVPGFRVARAYTAELAPDVPAPEVLVFDGGCPFGTPAIEPPPPPLPLGMVWRIGRGRVFYFTPCRSEPSLLLQPEVAQIVRNAVRWSADRA
jgi:RNA polymerase sigma-70 factor, ECF subfamily